MTCRVFVDPVLLFHRRSKSELAFLRVCDPSRIAAASVLTRETQKGDRLHRVMISGSGLCQQHAQLFGAADPGGLETGGERRTRADERRDVTFE